MNNVSTQILLPSIDNLRDLGGIINQQGYRIKERMLLRSGRLSKASAADLKVLEQDYQLRHIIDLRSPQEKYEAPDQRLKTMNWHDVLLQKDSMPGITQDEESLRKMREYFEQLNAACQDNDVAYQHMADFYYQMGSDPFCHKGLKQVMQILLKSEGACLWHCSLGRDRCGVTSAVILKTLDVDWDSIIADYLHTNDCMVLDQFTSYNYSHAIAGYLEAFFQGIEDYCGSYAEFEKQLLENEAAKEKLKEKYLTEVAQ